MTSEEIRYNELLKLKNLLEENDVPFEAIYETAFDKTANRIVLKSYNLCCPSLSNLKFCIYQLSGDYNDIENQLLSIFDISKKCPDDYNDYEHFSAEQAFEIIKNHFESGEE